MSTLQNSREGFCPPCKICGRDYVHLYKYQREGLSPGGILSYITYLYGTSFFIVLVMYTRSIKAYSLNLQGSTFLTVG